MTQALFMFVPGVKVRLVGTVVEIPPPLRQQIFEIIAVSTLSEDKLACGHKVGDATHSTCHQAFDLEYQEGDLHPDTTAIEANGHPQLITIKYGTFTSTPISGKHLRPAS